jgi:hypothetical protein
MGELGQIDRRSGSSRSREQCRNALWVRIGRKGKNGRRTFFGANFQPHGPAGRESKGACAPRRHRKIGSGRSAKLSKRGKARIVHAVDRHRQFGSAGPGNQNWPPGAEFGQSAINRNMLS